MPPPLPLDLVLSLQMSPLTGAALPSCRGGDRHNPAIGAGDTLYTAYTCHSGAFQDRKGRISSDQRIKKTAVCLGLINIQYDPSSPDKVEILEVKN